MSDPRVDAVEQVKEGLAAVIPYNAGDAVFQVNDAVSALDNLIRTGGIDLGQLANLLANVRQARADLGELEKVLEDKAGEAMGDNYQVTVLHVGTLERHREESWKDWNKDALLRDVLDSRLVNTETGEVVDESPLDKVLKVWNLPAPRRTVLKQRGLDPEDYAKHTIADDAPWKIRIHGS